MIEYDYMTLFYLDFDSHPIAPSHLREYRVVETRIAFSAYDPFSRKQTVTTKHLVEML